MVPERISPKVIAKFMDLVAGLNLEVVSEL